MAFRSHNYIKKPDKPYASYDPTFDDLCSMRAFCRISSIWDTKTNKWKLRRYYLPIGVKKGIETLIDEGFCDLVRYSLFSITGSLTPKGIDFFNYRKELFENIFTSIVETPQQNKEEASKTFFISWLQDAGTIHYLCTYLANTKRYFNDPSTQS